MGQTPSWRSGCCWMSLRVPLGSVAQSTAYPGWPARFSRLQEPELWVSAAAAAVSVVVVALLAVSVLTAMAVFAAVVLEAVASASAVAVSVVAAFAVAIVVAAESAVVAAAADSAVPSPPGPRSALSRGPRSRRRDWHLGRAPECRSRPSLHFRLRIPESMYLQQDSSSAGLAPGCCLAGAASVSSG